MDSKIAIAVFFMHLLSPNIAECLSQGHSSGFMSYFGKLKEKISGFFRPAWKAMTDEKPNNSTSSGFSFPWSRFGVTMILNVIFGLIAYLIKFGLITVYLPTIVTTGEILGYIWLIYDVSIVFIDWLINKGHLALLVGPLDTDEDHISEPSEADENAPNTDTIIYNDNVENTDSLNADGVIINTESLHDDSARNTNILHGHDAQSTDAIHANGAQNGNTRHADGAQNSDTLHANGS